MSATPNLPGLALMSLAAVLFSRAGYGPFGDPAQRAKTRHPAENLIVTVRRTHAPSYMVHLQVHRVGKVWTISAFDRI